jgi:hypothetical protein
MRGVLLCLVLVVGCKERNPHFCAMEPDRLCQPDGGDTVDCEDSSDCATVDDKHVCATPPGVCVQCTEAEASACTGTAPICDPMSNTCVRCEEHADCDSDVCMPDGSCAASANVAYVAPNASGNCDLGTPCGTLDAALGTNREVVKLAAGMFTMHPNTITIEGDTVTIVGEDDASVIRRASGTQFLIQGVNTNVTLYRLTVGGSVGANTIELQPNSGTPKLTLERVTIGGMGQRIAINGNGGELTMTRSKIVDHDFAAIVLSNTRYRITNNFFVENGATTSSYSAIQITGGTATDVFEFNTIAANLTMDGLATAMDCTGPATVRNNIIFFNAELTPATIKHVDGTCTYDGNIIGEGGTPSQNYMNNLDMDPLFVDKNTGNYMLSAGSPAKSKAVSGAQVLVDFQGEPRPNPMGTPADLGADEVP